VVADGAVTFRLRATGPGTAYAHVWDGRPLGTTTTVFTAAGTRTITVRGGTTGVLAVAYEAAAAAGGGIGSLVAPLG
jgi:hypothetical protein